MPWTPEEGDVLYGSEDEYELLEYVDTGGFTTVYRSRERSTGRIVGVKYPNFGSINDDVDENVEREVRALRTIEAVGGHPNMMTLREHFVMRGTDFLVVEFVDGTELADSDELAGIETVRNVALVVCDAISLLHENGLVYRDLSGQNLLLTPSRDPMLIDFNMIDRATRCGECGWLATAARGRSERCNHCERPLPTSSCFDPTGTSPFRAAEQFEPDLPVGPWSDVYAVGKLLYYLIEGYPRQGDGVNPATDNDSCPEYLGQIVEIATAFDPSERYETAAHLGQALWKRDPDPGSLTAVFENTETGVRRRVSDGSTIGREPKDEKHETEQQLLADPPATVSREHLRIDRDERSWKLTDTSKNGTYIRRNDAYHRLCAGIADQDDPTVAPDSGPPQVRMLQHGDVVSLVDPLHGPSLRFHANEWGVR